VLDIQETGQNRARKVQVECAGSWRQPSKILVLHLLQRSTRKHARSINLQKSRMRKPKTLVLSGKPIRARRVMSNSRMYLTNEEINKIGARVKPKGDVCAECGQKPVFERIFGKDLCRKHALMYVTCECGRKFKPWKPDQRLCRWCFTKNAKAADQVIGLRKTRFVILNRDGFCCFYCGASAPNDGAKLHVDHVIPRSRGGKDIASNLVTSCSTCNQQKNAMIIMDVVGVLKAVKGRNKMKGIPDSLEISFSGS
jgi:hypothetical protein